MKKLVLFDSNSLIHRAYHALPPLKTKKGQLVNAVYGFLNVFFKVVSDLSPDYLAAAFDIKGPTFRDLAYREYKAKRVSPPKELFQQIPLIKKALKVLSVPIYEKEGFEADDVIGTIVYLIKKEKRAIKVIVASSDLDILQLVDRNVEVYALGRKGAVVYNRKSIKVRYQLQPQQIIDFKALRGDPSDNIPGVPGIGEKTAVELIKKFGNLKKLYQNLQESGLNPKLKARLLEYKDQAFFSQYLATIKKDVPIDFDLNKCRWGNYNKEEVIKLLKELEFGSLIKRLPML